MPDQLLVINDALAGISEREIVALELSGGTSEPARVMAAAWPAAVDFCLSLAPWRFASRMTSVAYLGNSDDDPHAGYAAPGYDYAYPIPADHLRTNWVRDRSPPIGLPIEFHAQDGYWHTLCPTLVASYVSHQYRPPETWTPMFGKVVAAYLTWQRGPRIRPAADGNELRLMFEAIRDAAMTTDASDVSFRWNVPGRLSRSRGGYCGSREQGRRW